MAAAGLLMGLANRASAQVPAPLQTPTPFSWVQFKQDYGVLEPGNDVSLPGTPTMPLDSAQSTADVWGGTVVPNNQIPGYLLGDILGNMPNSTLGTNLPVGEPPNGPNMFRDAQANSINVENWLAPFYNLSAGGQPLSNATIDDNNTYNTLTYTDPTNGPTTITYGTYIDGGSGSTQTGVGEPNVTGNPLNNPTNQVGWETATGDPVFELNYYLVDYRRSQNPAATAGTESQGLVARNTNPNVILPYNGATALATWAFAMPVAGSNPTTIQGIPFNPAAPVAPFPVSTTPPNVTPASTIIRNPPVVQYYTAYTWFPSQNADPGAPDEELHISDAEYTVQVTDQFTGAVISTMVSYVDQRGGGIWVKVAGPFAVPLVRDPNNNLVPAIVTVTLDNTTSMTVGGNSVIQMPNYHVIANAVQLQPSNGFMYSSPVSVNVSDYPELAYGYTVNHLTNPTVSGGTPITYRRAATTIPNAFTAASIPTTSGGNYFALGNTPNYTEDKWGDTLGAFVAPVNPRYTIQLVNGDDNGHPYPIDQVVYMTRSENLGNFQNNITQAVGAVYAINGLTGDVIWRFPSVMPIIVDNDDPIDFAAGGFTNNATGPGTNFYALDYATTPAVAGAATATATWTIPIPAAAGTQNYYVYVWYPSPAATELHVNDARYTVAGQACNFVNQQINGGQWVQLTYNGGGNPVNPVFALAAGTTITLSNLTADVNPVTGNPFPNTFIDADAVLVIPTNAPGPISGTPVVVRNMVVNVDAAGDVAPRDVVIFGDNNPSGGRLYCLDAAGNGDGDDTVVGQDGEPASYGSTGTGMSAVNGNLQPPPGAPVGFEFDGPLHPLQYGTTASYWIWQPSSNPSQVVLQQFGTETPETTPDPNRDLPVPGAYELNTPTVALATNTLALFSTAVTNDPAQPANTVESTFDATLFVGNSNGYLYSLNGVGVFDNNSAASNQAIFRHSLDNTMPTPAVNWWFGTGGSIAYAPAYNPQADANTGDPSVYATSFDPGGNNQGRVFSVDAVKGPLGNSGAGDPKLVGNAQVPGSLNYNITQIPFWSFPDGYGTVKGANGATLPNTQHLVTSKVAGFNGAAAAAFPLGDIAGAPTVYTANGTPDNQTRIYFAANDPTPDGDGPGVNGRIYSVYTSGLGNEGRAAWVYPDIAGDPNAVGTNNQLDATFAFNPNGTATPNLPAQPLGAFTVFEPNSGYFVSSSPVAGQITFPALLYPTGTNPFPPPNLGGLQDKMEEMLYTGCTDGTLYALNLGVGDDPTTTGDFDTNRLIYNEPVGDGPIYSTPVLMGGSSQNTPPPAAGTPPDVGGAVFLTTSVGDIWEFEATPYEDPTGQVVNAPLVNRDWGWAGPGGLSSPAVASFDATGFNTQPGNAAAPADTPSPVLASAATGRNDSEWLYAGSDTGFLYAFTPNLSTAGGFSPGNYIPTENIGPNNSINLTRNFLSAIYVTNPVATGTPNSIDWSKGAVPPNNPAFDWGQTVYIAIFGIDNPAVNDGVTPDPGTGQAYPIGINLTIGLSESLGTNSNRALPQREVDLRDAQWIAQANPATFPPAAYATAVSNGTLNLGENEDDHYYAVVFPYQLGLPSSADPQTPGAKIQVTAITETALAVNNGSMQQITVRGITGGPNLVNTGTGGTNTLGVTPAVDQATFGILNPLGVAGAGTTLSGGQSNIALTSVPFTPQPTELGPFAGVDGTVVGNFAGAGGFQWADANGNQVPTSPPVGGTDTTTTGNPINPTQSLSSQGESISYAAVTVAADAGEVGHGTTGDTGTGSTVNPQAPGTFIADPVLTDPNFTYGSSFLNVVDRSALGSIGDDITDLRMSDPQMGWNDNSDNSGGAVPNSVINMLPWDIPPTSFNISPTNSSPDYPNIAPGAVDAQITPRNENIVNFENGVQGDVTSGDGTLANAQQTAGANPSTRNVRPNAVLVQVTVPKFQPANLESFDASPTALPEGVPYSHVQNGAAGAGVRVPQGYMARVRVFVDSAGTGKYVSTDANRVVNVWIGVPVDMSMAIGQSTTDIKSVPAGFGLWQPNNVAAIGPPDTPGAWSPYSLSPGGSGQPLYQPWYVPVPVYNTGNVNLLNVHFDQNTATYNGTGIQPGLPLTLGEGLGMVSDTVADQGTTGVQLWPFEDMGGPAPGAGYYSGTPNLMIVRSNLDQDIYTNYPVNPAFGAGGSPVPGPTAHKARPGTAPPGAPIQIPDDPLDVSNGDWVNPSSTQYPSRFYSNEPAVSIAVPLGTPVGSYHQTLRTFEGSDVPYNSWTGPTYGGLAQFYIPGTWNAAASSQYAFVFGSTSNSPMQFFSDPGTELHANVIEDRVTDDSTIMTNLLSPGGTDNEYGSLSMLDPQRLLGAGANTTSNPGPTPAHSNDIQPWAFRDITGNAGVNGGFGLLWPSQRAFVTAGSTSPGYDIFAASLNALNTPTSPQGGTAAGAWWSGEATLGLPDNLTDNTAARNDWANPPPAALAFYTSYSPYVVPSNVQPVGTGSAAGTDPNTALEVDSLVGGAPNYAIKYYQFKATEPQTVPNWAILTTSTSPIFAPRGCYVDGDSALNGQSLVVFWSETAGGRSQIYYQSPAPAGSNTPVLSGTLEIPAGVTNASNPTPITRPFTYPWPAGNNNMQNWPVIDVTFSGVSTLNGETDVYTTRYIVYQKVAGGPVTLLSVPFYAQQNAGDTGVTETPVSETLTSDSTNSVWEAQDVGWVRDLSTFSLSSVTGPVATPIIGGNAPALSTLPVYDRSSGQWVFSNVALPWLAGQTTTTGTVYVNPDQGTVRFSTPPMANPNAAPPTAMPVIIAGFVPQALRATVHSGTNSAPISFVDEAYKPNALQPASNLGGTTQPVIASRYWYIWRKSGSTASGTATASTLYFKTRRLTVVLPSPVGYMGNAGNTATPINIPNVTVTIPGAGAQPVTQLVDISPGYYIASTQPTGGQPQFVPGRIFFPDYINVGGVNYSTEGLTATVNYQPAPYQGESAIPPPVTNYQQTVQWLDEPYTNAPQTTLTGERAVPISSSINEGEPCAFLDPYAYQNGTGNFAPFPHRVWLFWVSTRNAPDITNGSLGTGSDIYSEALDPTFSDTSTPQ